MNRPSHSSNQAAILLGTLLAAPGEWRHGYGLMQETGLQSGSLYPLLIRLADDGFLDSEWETDTETARPRRVYRLNAAGRSLAHERVARAAARSGTDTNAAGAG